MAAAEYLVTVPCAPGIPIAGVGFVRVGDVFTAPQGYVPSRHLKPLNQEAVVELEKVRAALRAEAVTFRKTEKDDPDFQAHKVRARNLEAMAAAMDLGLFTAPEEGPSIKRAVVPVDDAAVTPKQQRESRKL